MKNIVSQSDFAGATKRQLQEFEKQLGAKLPKDFREYLEKHNGACLINAFFYLEKDDFYYWVDYLHHLDDHLFNPNVDAHYMSISFNHWKNGDYMPDNSIIIGTVANDHQLLLRLDKKHKGEIWIKMCSDGMPYAENADHWKNNKEESAFKLAGSFLDFMECLVESDLYDEDDDEELLL